VAGPAPRLAGPSAGHLQESIRAVRFDGEWLPTQVLRGEPAGGTRAEGPAIFELPETTLVVPPGWSAQVDGAGTLIARRERRDGT
jgi:N-methylhydantoinase A